MDKLQDRLDAGDVLILDGAIGTELQRRGAAMDGMAWCAVATKTSPDILRALHEDYIRAGADVITTNSFSAARHVLEPAGLGDQVIAINRSAVALARAARDAAAERPVWIAGSISCFIAGLDRWKIPTPEVAKASYREQADCLADAGVDLLLMEMMMDDKHSCYALEAALATGLPVWVGFSCRLADDGATVLMYSKRADDIRFDDLLPTVMAVGGSVAGVMHSKLADTGPALDVLLDHWSGPVMAYPESGEEFTMPMWNFGDAASPDDFAATMATWVAKGVQIIGGCCGFGPDHIRTIKDRLPARVALERNL